MSFGKFLASPIGSALRIFVALVLGSFVAFLANGSTFADLRWDDLAAWVGAAIVVALPIIIAAVNPADPRFGNVVERPVTPPTSE